MTETDESAEPQGSGGKGAHRRCRWCRIVLPEQQGRGRPRAFCSQKCRQWDWVSRQRAAELSLSEGELVMARSDLDALHDELYVLSCAVADVRRDMGSKMTARETAEALQWLLDAAAPLANRRLGAG
jgi:hypothetical protein